jgi:hypothetical protein
MRGNVLLCRGVPRSVLLVYGAALATLPVYRIMLLLWCGACEWAWDCRVALIGLRSVLPACCVACLSDRLPSFVV